jgi:2-polyprenyl-3-methyl-5-hydroxy-6-metoxy-1,4-benzoquinol methylase
LSLLSGWEGGPSEGWQYPFDLGHGIVTKTYTDVQAELHPWRKNVLLNSLDKVYAGRYHELSVLDLGSCEGAMALALWERGVRDITCVEARSSNVEKARFVFMVKKADIVIVQQDVLSFLRADQKRYDLILFMGLLYHLLDPFLIVRLAAKRAKGVLAMETVVAIPHELTFDNVAHYSPSTAGFFVRHDSVLSNTAGLSDLELWPNREGLELLLRDAGFADIREMDYGQNPVEWYATKQRTMLMAAVDGSHLGGDY